MLRFRHGERDDTKRGTSTVRCEGLFVTACDSDHPDRRRLKSRDLGLRPADTCQSGHITGEIHKRLLVDARILGDEQDQDACCVCLRPSL